MTKVELLKAVALAVAILSLSHGSAAAAQAKSGGPPKFGAQDAEASPNRRQEWLLPTQDQITPSRAILFRPQGNGPFRLALIAHASTQNRLRRAQMPLPDYPGLAAALVARGFAVVVPQRLGHGKTGGPYLEDQEGCDNADYAASALSTGESITTAMSFMRAQPFIRKDSAVVIGHSAGGWGALSLVDQNPKNISAIVVFAPGRGGRKDDRAGSICAPEKLIASATDFGDGAKVPVTWIVAENDSYFPPSFSKQMADAYLAAGGKLDFLVLPVYGDEGHWLAETKDQALMDSLLAAAQGLAIQTPRAQGAGPGVAAKAKP
jgi:dienelactone hydrolase